METNLHVLYNAATAETTLRIMNIDAAEKMQSLIGVISFYAHRWELGIGCVQLWPGESWTLEYHISRPPVCTRTWDLDRIWRFFLTRLGAIANNTMIEEISIQNIRINEPIKKGL